MQEDSIPQTFKQCRSYLKLNLLSTRIIALTSKKYDTPSTLNVIKISCDFVVIGSQRHSVQSEPDIRKLRLRPAAGIHYLP